MHKYLMLIFENYFYSLSFVLSKVGMLYVCIIICIVTFFKILLFQHSFEFPRPDQNRYFKLCILFCYISYDIPAQFL